ncbi:MAG TPA: glycosyltransferase [Azospirillum sp.]|nr:glycosyltransferase [Azospirillum sp.]
MMRYDVSLDVDSAPKVHPTAVPDLSGLKQYGIAIYLPALGRGGAERVVVNLATAFAALGYPVTIFIHSCRKGHYDIADGVEVVDLGVKRTLGAIPRLAAELKARRPAALLSALTAANTAAYIARALSGVPMRLIVSEHAPLLLRCRFGPDPIKRLLLFGLNAFLYRAADAVVAVSTGIREELMTWLHLPPRQVHVIHNPVVPANLQQAMAERPDHPWFGAGGDPVILGIGRLVPEKNFPMLIDAVHRLRARRPVRLLIFGEGPERAALEKHIAELGAEEYLQLGGIIENPYPYYRHAALFVLSSNYEGFGNVLVESMACGTPVVSTRCPSGPLEILQDGKYGVLTPVGDVDAMVGAIDHALDIDWDRDRLRDRAADFAVETIAKQYLNILGR